MNHFADVKNMDAEICGWLAWCLSFGCLMYCILKARAAADPDEGLSWRECGWVSFVVSFFMLLFLLRG